MNEKVLEIALDDADFWNHTRYVVINADIIRPIFFEGTTGYDLITGQESKRITPLSEAKQWAREHGYTHLETVKIGKRGRNKIYIL
jgi:hypothetical protein